MRDAQKAAEVTYFALRTVPVSEGRGRGGRITVTEVMRNAEWAGLQGACRRRAGAACTAGNDRAVDANGPRWHYI